MLRPIDDERSCVEAMAIATDQQQQQQQQQRRQQTLINIVNNCQHLQEFCTTYRLVACT